MSDKCKICNVFHRKVKGNKKIIRNADEAEFFTGATNKVILVGEVICEKCRVKAHKSSAMQSRVSDATAVAPELPEVTEGQSSDSSTSLNNTDDDLDDSWQPLAEKNEVRFEVQMQRVIATHRYCFICHSETDLQRVSLETRCLVYKSTNIYIPEGNRCCRSHVIGNYLFEDVLSQLRVVSSTSNITDKELSSFLRSLSGQVNISLFNNISGSGICDTQLQVFTGLTSDNINELTVLLTSMRNTSARSIKQALIISLFKLRTGNSNKVIASIFGIKHEQQVSNMWMDILRSFENDIEFGYISTTREELLANTTHTARRLLGLLDDQLALIFDGTYIRHQKSQNNEYQRKSYSGQKKVPLCKPFTICTTNGFVVNFAGPFYGTQNDATIMKLVMQESDFQSLLRPNDVFIVDRGFRDVSSYLTEKGYVVHMPGLKGKRAQLPTIEANESRRVTKLRWVVEAVHGVISQKYRLLHHNLDNKILPKVKTLCKIVGFLHNKYGKRIDYSSDIDDEIIDQMEKTMHVPNTLSSEVESKRWSRRKTLLKMLASSEVLDFPRLTEYQLKVLFTGTYQLSQAVSYLAELLDNQNELCISYIKETANIIHCKVRSRHRNSKTYRVYIDYTPYSTEIEGVRRYCCDCPNGIRTIGCCSHVASIVYYLSHARFLSKILRPSEVLSKIFSTDNTVVVINENSDDDD